MPDSLSFAWHIPTDIRFGTGAGETLAALDDVRGRRIMLLAYPGFVRPDIVEKIRAAAGALVISDAFEENPRHALALDLATRVREERIDTIVAIGGGSTIDLAKGAAFFSENSGWDYSKAQVARPATIGVVAVPTTAGTGSEVSPFAVFSEEGTHRKVYFKHASVYPRVAICDPSLTATMPRRVTANTGVDALSHAVEAYLSAKCAGFMEAIALDACRLVAEYLPVALDEPGNLSAREKLLLAALEGGLVLAACGTVVVHAIGYGVTGSLNYPHGYANGILLAGLVERAAAKGADRARRLLDIFGGDMAGFIERAGIPQSLPPGIADAATVASWIDAGCAAYGLPGCVVPFGRDDVAYIVERVVR